MLLLCACVIIIIMLWNPRSFRSASIASKSYIQVNKLHRMSPLRAVLILSVVVATVVLMAVARLFCDDPTMYLYVKREDTVAVYTDTPLSIFSSPGSMQEYRTRTITRVKTVHNASVKDLFTADDTSTSAPSVSTANTVLATTARASPEVNLSNQYVDSPIFPIRSGFNFPHPQVFLSVQTILRADWVHQLKTYLLSIHPARSLTITVATKSFIPNLLNWLIAAHLLVEPPMEHVLVLAFDRDVHTLLAPRQIPCIHVPFSSVLKGKKGRVSSVWMTRFAVIRLLNHWGYDVLQLDSDAIPLKNPRYLFDAYPDYDIVSARAALPFELSRGPWGFTVCMGAALLRGTKGMETLWDVMQSAKMDKTTDDQKRINFALHKSELRWTSTENQYNSSSKGTTVNGVRVSTLPRKYVCRKSCSLAKASEVFVWHQSGGGHSAEWKSKHDAKSQMWFLRRDYNKRSIGHEVTGVRWLEQLTEPDSIQNVRHRLSTVTHTLSET